MNHNPIPPGTKRHAPLCPAGSARFRTSSTDEYARTRQFYAGLGYDEEARIREFYGPVDHKMIFWKSIR